MQDSATTTLSTAPLSSTAIPTELALARLAANRDPLAWAVLIERHGPAILRVAQRATHDRVLCEDICQETLLQIREHAGSFRAIHPAPPTLPAPDSISTSALPHSTRSAQPSSSPGGSVSELLARGWIMRIACRTALKMIRSRSRLSDREARSVPAVALPVSPEQHALRSEEQEQVRREVAALPDPHRDAISLRFFADFAYADIAESLQISEEAAKKRVQRGIDLLRSRLAIGGIALSATVVSSVLQNSAQAADTAAAGISTTTAASSAAAPVELQATHSAATELFFDESRRAAWQALVNTGQAPALSGIATDAVAAKSLISIGGFCMTGKVGAGIAAAVIAGLGIGGALEIRASRELANDALAAAHASTLQMKALERKLEDGRLETDSLRRLVESRNSELTSLRDKIADMGKKGSGQHGFTNVTPAIRAFPGGAAAGIGGAPGEPVAVIGGGPNGPDIEVDHVLELALDNVATIQKDGTTSRDLTTPNGRVRIITKQADVAPFNIPVPPPAGAPGAKTEDTRANPGETPKQTLERLKATTIQAGPRAQNVLIYRQEEIAVPPPKPPEKNVGEF